MATHNMKGKRVLVTGAGTGIGRGIALAFAKAKANVVIHYNSASGAKSAVKEITEAGGNAKAIKADLSNVEEVKKLGRQAIKFLGGVDVLVNNAGITFNREFEKATPEQYDRVYDVNCRAMYFLSQTVVPAMIDQGSGVIINITSNHAYAGYREHSIYAGTKGAIVAFTRALSVELARKGIRVLALAPGWVRTENQEKVMGKNFNWEEAGKILPAGFVASPEDVGQLVVCLASESGKYIYGQTLVNDGGELAIMPLTGNFWEPVEERYGKGYVPGL